MNERRKQLKEQYKERKIVGGVYRIINHTNGWFYLNKTYDMQGAHNMFLSSCTTGICTHPRLVKAWGEYGKESFAFEVLETWEKDDTQSDADFRNDLEQLWEIWDSKLPQEGRY